MGPDTGGGGGVHFRGPWAGVEAAVGAEQRGEEDGEGGQQGEGEHGDRRWGAGAGGVPDDEGTWKVEGGGQ